MSVFLYLIAASIVCQSEGRFSSWNSWSACSVDCGNGWTTREKVVILKGCYTELSEKKDCEVHCKSGINIAINKNVSASSTFLDVFPSSNAVDGNNNTDFYEGNSCMMTKKEKNPWLMIDLGVKSLVHQVTIFNRADCCSHRLNNVIVEVGDDHTGVRSKECGTQVGMEGVKYTRIICSQSLSGRYVHIRLHGPQFLSICEVEVFGGILTNLAIGKNASQSSSHYSSGFGADKALDGDLGSYTHTEKNGNEWWRIDLGRLAMVHAIRFHANDNSGKYDADSEVNVGKVAVKEEMSLCGTLNKTLRKQIENKYAYDVTCIKDIKGRFVQVDTVAKLYLVIMEFEVHGYFLE